MLSVTIFMQSEKSVFKRISMIHFVTRQQLIAWEETILLRKRLLIETVNDQLKTISQIEHTRYRSPQHFFINLLTRISAYRLQSKKPSLNLGSDHIGSRIKTRNSGYHVFTTIIKRNYWMDS